MGREDEPALLAAELRVVLGRLVRRLRAERAFPISHAVVLGHLDREGPQAVSELAALEHVRPQSMAQTVRELEEDGLVRRRPDPGDRRRAPVELTARGRTTLEAERSRREGWLATVIGEDLSAEERAVLGRAVRVLKRIAGS